MTRTEHLLFILAEECAEVAQRASKAARFGLHEIQPGHTQTNSERLNYELGDLLGAMLMLVGDGSIQPVEAEAIQSKRAQVEKFLEYSRTMGTLQ